MEAKRREGEEGRRRGGWGERERKKRKREREEKRNRNSDKSSWLSEEVGGGGG